MQSFSPLGRLFVVCLGLVLVEALIGCAQGTSTFASRTPAFTRSGNSIFLKDGAVISTAMVSQACNGIAPGAVVLPSGSVTVAATVVIPSHCTIQGQGMGVSTLLLAPNTSLKSPAILTNTKQPENLPATIDSNINLLNFTLDANTTNNPTASYAISMANLAYLTIDHVEISGGMVHFGGNVAGYDASYTHDLTITNNNFHDAGVAQKDNQDALQFNAQNVKVTGNTLGPSTDTGAALLGGSAANQTAHVLIANNVFFNNAQACGVAEGDPNRGRAPDQISSSWDVTVSDNTISCSGTYATGIFFNQSHNVTVSGNIIRISPKAGEPGNYTSPAILLGGVRDANVTGNQITGSRDAGIVLEAYGVNKLNGVTVTGNTIRSPNTYGILLISISGDNPGAELKNVTITGNTIIDPGNSSPMSGIVIGQAAISGGTCVVSGITVVGNTIVDDRTPSLMTYGIQYLGFPTNLTVSSNEVSGYTAAEYSAGN
jgi:parallel beta-helix repeat protein